MDNTHSLISKYLAGGVANSLLGYSVIFIAMYFGISPFYANVMGYFCGLLISFIINKYLVFKSAGSAWNEGYRFFIAFLISFGANLLTLHLLLRYTFTNEYIAQILASSTYTVTMWFFSLIIFKQTNNSTTQ